MLNDWLPAIISVAIQVAVLLCACVADLSQTRDPAGDGDPH